MRADTTDHLREAANRKHDECLSRVPAVVREADRRRQPVTRQGVVISARVAPSWIHTQAAIYEVVPYRRVETDSPPSARVLSEQVAEWSGQLKQIELLATRRTETSEDTPRWRSELAAEPAVSRRMRQLQPRQTGSSEQREKSE